MKTPRDIREQISNAKSRLKAWEAIKQKYPVNTEWWRDFYLSPNHAENKGEAQEQARRAGSEIAAEELEAERQASVRATRAEAVNRSSEARASRRADGLRILSLASGHVGVAFLLLHIALRLVGLHGQPWLDTLWVFGLFVTPLCYVMAFVFASRASSLWEKANAVER